METNSNSRLYKIQPDPAYFSTGRTANGNQILVGVQLPEIVMVVFNAEGSYLRILTRDIPKTLLSGNSGGHTWVDDKRLSAEIEKWRHEIEFVPSTISIKQFFLPDRYIGIEDMPDYFQEILDQPELYDEEFRRRIQEEKQRWQACGYFVLHWNETYHLNREGEIVST